MRKKIGFLLMVAIIAALMLASVANAAVDPLGVDRASEYIAAYDGNIESTSEGTVTVNFSIVANRVMTVLGAKTIVLQERASSLDSWDTYGTYGYEDYANMMDSNSKSYANGLTIDVTSGMYYRAKVYFYAEDGGYDTRTFITNSVQAD